MGYLDILRYTFYGLDFIFGVLAWGITANKLERNGICLLSNTNERALSTNSCDAVIALGVITMIILVAIVVFRTLDYMGIMRFPEIIEFFSFCLLTLIWLILAIVVVAVTDSGRRELGRVRGAIAGAWLAFISHTGSTITSFICRGKEDVEAEGETKE